MPDSENQVSGKQIATSISLFTLGFALSAALLHSLIQDPLRLHADVRSEKLLMLDHGNGNIPSAAFGSSHVHDGFDPRVFDQVLSGSPAQTRTLNLAIEGGSQSEQRVMALEFLKDLKTPPAPVPCLVLLELNAGANFTPDHLVHPRSIDIYDLPTARFISHLIEPRMSLRQRVGRIGFALVATFLHYINTGMLSNWIFSPPIDADAYAHETKDDRRGVDLLSKSSVASDNNNLANSLALAHRPASPQLRPAALTPGNTELLEQLSSAARGRHLSFAYFVMPKTSDLYAAPEYPDHLTISTQGTLQDVPILNMARPDRYPEFYRPEFWHDTGHVDAQGSALVTRALAEQLRAWYQAHGQPSACAQ